MRNKHRKEYKLAICAAKKTANDKFVLDHHNNASAVWKLINAKRPSAKINDIDNNLDADTINVFLTNISKDLVNQLKPTADPIVYMTHSRISDGGVGYFSFRGVSQVEVRNVIELLKNSRTVDVYGLNTIMLKKEIILLFREPHTFPFSTAWQVTGY